MAKGRWEEAGHRGQLGAGGAWGACAGRPSAVPTLDAAGVGEGEEALLPSARLEASVSPSAEDKASFLGGQVCKQELPGPPHAKASAFRGRWQGDWGSLLVLCCPRASRPLSEMVPGHRDRSLVFSTK